MQPRTVPHPTGAEIVSLPEENRAEYLRSLGAQNMDPPLPQSSHLKLLKTGRVILYTELLAAHRDLAVNCDQYGNTDPSAWEGTVPQEEGDPYERRLKELELQAVVYAQSQKITDASRVENAVDMTPKSTALPAGAVSFGDLPVAPRVTAQPPVAKAISLDMTGVAAVPAPDLTPKPTEYPYNAIPLGAVANLQAMLES